MIYTREEAAEKIIAAGLKLVEKGLIARTWGNISARLSDTEFLITPSGMAYDTLTPELLVVCKIEDCSYEGEVRPSGEKAVHAEAYKYRSDVDFIVHTHQLYGTVAGAVGRSLKARNEKEKALLGERVPVAKYAISSTKPLAANVAECIKKHPTSNALFMKCHGVLCMGIDSENAFAISEVLENLCKDLIEKNMTVDVAEKMAWPEDYDPQVVIELVKEYAGKEAVAFASSEAVVKCSALGKKIYPVIDDMAQIAGVNFPCVDLRDPGALSAIVKVLTNKGVIFVYGLGAVIASENEDELQAISTVLNKNCLAQLFAMEKGVKKHLTYPDALYQRMIYVKKYSKQMK